MSEIADFLKAVQHAMRLEGIPEESIEHVINRLVYGDPHGLVARRRASEASEAGKGQIHLNVTMPSMSAQRAITLAVEGYNRRMGEFNRR